MADFPFKKAAGARVLWAVIVLAALWAAAFLFTLPQDASGKPSTALSSPNVIVVITDDQGYRDVGFNDSEDIRTPQIDRIANEGVRFTRGYVTFPACAPSRAGLMTGRHQSRYGFDRNPDNDPGNPLSGLPLTEETLSEYLKRGGYATMAVGKWHLGTHPSLRPMARGFDEYFGFLEGGHTYFPEDIAFDSFEDYRKPFDWYRGKLVDNGKRVGFERYLTDELSDRAVDFVRRSGSGKAPFFLYLAYNAPHGPLQASERHLARVRHIKDKRRRTYAAMIGAVDEGVGRVLDELDRQGIADNTIVVFLSDNGGFAREKRGKRPAADNGSLKGGKGSLWEGGVRVPFAIRWPARLAAGLDYNRPVSSMDIFGTVAAATRIPLRQDRPLDGVDLIPFLAGETAGDPQPLLFFRQLDEGEQALVAGDTKLVGLDDNLALYDLRRDEGERAQLEPAETEDLDRLAKIFEAWEAQMAQKPAFPPLGNWPKPARGETNSTIALIAQTGVTD